MAARGYNLEEEMKKRETLERVYEYLRAGGFGVGEIADFRRVEDVDAENEMKFLEIWHKSGKSAAKEQRRYEICRDAVKKGAGIKEIAGLLGVKSEKTAYNYLVGRRLLEEYRRRHESNTWKAISEEERERREGILERVAAGEINMAEGAREIGVSRQRMPALLRGKEGRYKIWRENFENAERKRIEMQRKKKLEERAMEDIRKKLIWFAVKNAGSRAEKKALGVYFGWYCKARGTLPYDRVLKIFEVYYDCKSRGEKMNFLEIGNVAGCGAMSARRILQRGREKSLCWNWGNEKKR